MGLAGSVTVQVELPLDREVPAPQSPDEGPLHAGTREHRLLAHLHELVRRRCEQLREGIALVAPPRLGPRRGALPAELCPVVGQPLHAPHGVAEQRARPGFVVAHGFRTRPEPLSAP